MHHSEERARELLLRLPTGAVRGVEIGVYRGEMSAQLLRLHPGLHLVMVDNWLEPRYRPQRYRATRDPRAKKDCRGDKHLACRATEFAADRRTVMHTDSLEAAGTHTGPPYDFVFIDAEHTYEAVTEDIAAWLPTLRPGGLLSGHDYSVPGERSVRGWPGVVRAVNEAVKTNGWTLERGAQATWFVRLPGASGL